MSSIVFPRARVVSTVGQPNDILVQLATFDHWLTVLIFGVVPETVSKRWEHINKSKKWLTSRCCGASYSPLSLSHGTVHESSARWALLPDLGLFASHWIFLYDRLLYLRFLQRIHWECWKWQAWEVSGTDIPGILVRKNLRVPISPARILSMERVDHPAVMPHHRITSLMHCTVFTKFQ